MKKYAHHIRACHAESEAEQVKVAIAHGVSQYVVKPFSAEIILEKLKSVFAKKGELSVF